MRDRERIRVLVVDDSPTICRYLAEVLARPGDLAVVGTALSGERAIVLAESLTPDVIVLDLTMPGMGGLAAIEQIMARCPTPIVVVSGLGAEAIGSTMTALERGAVDYLPKYRHGRRADPATLNRTLITKIRIAAANRVAPAATPPVRNTTTARPAKSLIVVGASTGGPAAIRDFLGAMPTATTDAVVVVQHLPRSYTRSLAIQLDRNSPLPVREAVDRDLLHAGQVLLAPGDRHLEFEIGQRIRLTNQPPVNGHRPSIDVTMTSAATVWGSSVAGVLLTGMGQDGAAGLLAIRKSGGRTYAQDDASCVVGGMPARARDFGAVQETDSPAKLACRIANSQGRVDHAVAL